MVEPDAHIRRDPKRCSRRAFIGSLAAVSAIALPHRPSHAAGKTRPRVVSLDLSATDVCVFAGTHLIGATIAGRLRGGQSDFSLAPSVTDLGASDEPNLELLAELRPDAIVSAWPRPVDSRLTGIAPVVRLPIFVDDGDKYERFATAVRQVSAQTKSPAKADAALDEAQRLLSRLSNRRRTASVRKVILASLNDDGASVRLYGSASIVGSTLRRLGCENAWSASGGPWGWAHVRPEELRQWPDAHVIEITQYWDGVAPMRETLLRSPVWRDLSQVRSGRISVLPPVTVLGGLSTALRFASLVTDALLEPRA